MLFTTPLDSGSSFQYIFLAVFEHFAQQVCCFSRISGSLYLEYCSRQHQECQLKWVLLNPTFQQSNPSGILNSNVFSIYIKSSILFNEIRDIYFFKNNTCPDTPGNDYEHNVIELFPLKLYIFEALPGGELCSYSFH